MYPRIVLILVCLAAAQAGSSLLSFKNLKSYARILHLDRLLTNRTGNELWDGLLRDCDRSVTFSCIQRNAYSYLDDAFVERDNITVFDGLTLTRNRLDYGTCRRKDDQDTLDENLVDDSGTSGCDEEESEEVKEEEGRGEEETPLEEVTSALRKKAVKFLATRDYEIQLPELFFEGAAVKISPREVDENGALLRVDFGQRAVESQGRIFKKLSTIVNL